MQRFILIDGNAIMHRAWHALPMFTTSKGQPVGAVFGFISMLLRIISDLQPSYIVAAFDRPKPTFRQALYAGYHANRPEMEDDFASQFPLITELLGAFDIPVFAIDGYEGDDVIGTIATKVVDGGKEKIEVIIVSGDRDMLQLVNGHVKVYMPIKGLTEAKLYDSAGVVEKYGIEPRQVIDLKALMGDASDGYPGVAGIGPKTASLLLQKYHTLENLYQHLGELPERQTKVLAEGAEAAGLAKKLATIVTDCPLTLDLRACEFTLIHKEKAVKALQDLEFRTLTNRLLELLGEKPIELPKPSTLKIEKKKDAGDQLTLV